MRYMVVFILFFSSFINLKSQSFYALAINIVDYEMIDYALRRTLTEEEYKTSGVEFIVIIFIISNKGDVIRIKSINYAKGNFRLQKLNEDIFKLNLKKYVKFKVPEFYYKEDSIAISQTFKKN